MVFSKSLETTNYAIAFSRSKPIIQEWKELIAVARRKEKGEVTNLEERIQKAADKFKELGFTDQGLFSVAIVIGISAKNVSEDKLVEAYGAVTKRMTPILKHLEDWLSETGYAKAGEDEARNYFKKRFVKVFKHWESIDQNELKAYVRSRQEGSDGERAWSDRTCEKNLNLVKQYWNWMLDNDHIEIKKCPNPIYAARLMKRKANTKKNCSETNADANLPYSIEECWAFVDTAEKDGCNMLPEVILLGMYTGCRIEELSALKLEDVGSDYFAIQDGKTEASKCRLPIHSAIKQMVERLVQDSKDGYLLSGLSSNNQYNYRSAAISRKFGYLKTALGFESRIHSFHSFRPTLATRLQNAKVDPVIAAKLVGHSVKGMTYGLYAGDPEWENALAAMSVITYPRPKTEDDTSNSKKGWLIQRVENREL